jgi:hypothetical protein
MFRQSCGHRGHAGTVRSDTRLRAVEGGQRVDLVADDKDPVARADLGDGF